MPSLPYCSGCMTGLPHYCNFFSHITHPQSRQTSSVPPLYLDVPRDYRTTNSPPIRLPAANFYGPPTPQPLPGLPWAPLSRRDRLHIQPYPLYALPHPVPASRRSTKVNSKVVYTPPAPFANIWPPAALTPIANHDDFESDWREDNRQFPANAISAYERRRLALPRLRTQFFGRDVREVIPCVDVNPMRGSVFREEMGAVAESGYDGDDEGSRHTNLGNR